MKRTIIYKRFSRLCLVWLCLAAGINGAEPSAPPVYSLEQLVLLARENNLMLKVYDLDRDIARQEYRAERGFHGLEIEYSRGEGRIDAEPGTSRQLWEFSGKWTIPNPVYRYYRLKSSRNHVLEAEIGAEMNSREILQQLHVCYYDLRLHSKVKTFLEEKIRLLENIHRLSRAKADIGETREIDALSSAVEIQKEKTRLFRIEKTMAAEKSKLAEILDGRLPGDFTVPGDFPYQPLPGDLEARVGQSIEQSLPVQLAYHRQQAQKALYRATGLSLIEGLGISGGYGQEVEGKTWQLGLGIMVPVFSGKSAQIRQAKLQAQKAGIEYDHEKKHLGADVARILAEIRILEKEIETFQGAILEQGKQNLDLSEKLFQEGEVLLSVFLDAQNSYFDLQTGYFQAITEWSILKAGLDALLGELP